MSSSNQRKKETLLIVNTDDPFTFIVNRRTKYSLQNLKAQIHCSIAQRYINQPFSHFLKSQLPNTAFFDSDCRAMSCLQEKKKKGQGRGSKNFFPQGASKPTLRQDSSQKLWFVMEKGWKSGRCWEHFMARTAYMGHLRIDDQASLWLSSYCAHLITYWENSIHHPLPTSSENNATARSSFPVRADCQEQ